MSVKRYRCLCFLMGIVLISISVWAEADSGPSSWQQLTVSLDRSLRRAGRIQKKTAAILEICDEILEKTDQLRIWARRS